MAGQPLFDWGFELPSLIDHLPTRIQNFVGDITPTLRNVELPYPLKNLLAPVYTKTTVQLADILNNAVRTTEATRLVELCRTAAKPSPVSDAAPFLEERKGRPLGIVATSSTSSPLEDETIMGFSTSTASTDSLVEAAAATPGLRALMANPRLGKNTGGKGKGNKGSIRSMTVGKKLGAAIAKEVEKVNKHELRIVWTSRNTGQKEIASVLKDARVQHTPVCLLTERPTSVLTLPVLAAIIPLATCYSALVTPAKSSSEYLERLFWTFYLPIIPLTLTIDALGKAFDTTDLGSSADHFEWTIERKSIVSHAWEVVGMLGMPKT
ncbi:hypothetical protein BC832DRAFT_616262 [Gaertneriomyces semiglobifer]|nr:hypothetical protein BC832DRAFT_616262 [Gaertneriomyces semiglobifer]